MSSSPSIVEQPHDEDVRFEVKLLKQAYQRPGRNGKPRPCDIRQYTVMLNGEEVGLTPINPPHAPYYLTGLGPSLSHSEQDRVAAEIGRIKNAERPVRVVRARGVEDDEQETPPVEIQESEESTEDPPVE